MSFSSGALAAILYFAAHWRWFRESMIRGHIRSRRLFHFPERSEAKDIRDLKAAYFADLALCFVGVIVGIVLAILKGFF